MAEKMKIDDEIRLNLLEALLKKNSVVPNMRQLKRYTGYHKATIKSSLDFMQDKGLLEGYGPKVNFRSLGFNLEVMALLQADLSQKKVFKSFLEKAGSDPHVYNISSVIGSGNWNLISRHFYKDVESYYQDTQKKYFESIPGIFDLVKDRQLFYATEPNFKKASRTESIIKIIRKEKGLE